MKTTIILATTIFITDALILNQGGIAVITMLVVVLIFLPKAIYSHIRKREYKTGYFKCLIYGCTALLIFGSNYLNNMIAHNRSEMLITTIEQYKSDNGVYPETLEALVPKYVQYVPPAKLSLSMNKFWYHRQGGDASLFYVSVPPYGRPIYNFNNKQWSYLD